MVDLIAPSILAANMLDLGAEIKAVLAAGADLLHIDVMDNHYVPNLTFGPELCNQIKQEFPQAILDVHLMTTPVDDLIMPFAKAGAKRISIHPDATFHLDRSLALIKQQHCEAGIVLNPATTPECLKWCNQRLDFVLVMAVNPGFGGQTFITAILEKITWIHKYFPTLPICVDGGITIANVASLKAAGATQFVLGTTIFRSLDYRKTIQEIRQQLR